MGRSGVTRKHRGCSFGWVGIWLCLGVVGLAVPTAASSADVGAAGTGESMAVSGPGPGMIGIPALDPFADLRPASSPGGAGPVIAGADAARGVGRRPTTRSFHKREVFSQVTWRDGGREPYRRISLGGELLQRFSDPVETWGSFDLQLRLVHRAAFIPTTNDAEGEDRERLTLEYHNAYLDLFNVFDPLLSPANRAAHLGRFNLRLGRFYLPSGLNLQTDTHGTLLQLSNERNLGFERDWMVGLWGGLSRDLNYDLAALAGSGYDLRREGQKGLLGARVSLANRFRYEHGLEAGLSVLTGERIAKHALMRSPGVAARADDGRFIETRRIGLDVRKTRAVEVGTVAVTGEFSMGRDEDDDVTAVLGQIELLRRDRRLGYALQFRRFHQEVADHPGMQGHGEALAPTGRADVSLIGEVTWYFRNDIDNSNLHWIKVNVERQTERMLGPRGVLTTLQYYRYW